MLKQAARIEQLEGLVGVAYDTARLHWVKTHRMIFWESSVFFIVILISTLFLLWIYWRESLRFRSLQAFFAAVTHELRTPLTGMRLQAESIAELTDKGDYSEHTTLINRLFEDLLRLESHVERTLELARLEGGGAVFTRALALRPVVDRALSDWQEFYKNRIEVEVRGGEDVAVDADPIAIQVIIKNLIENSIRHAGREKVKVMISFDAERRALIFRDDGQGFSGDAKQLGKLFKKSQASQGAGIGLYLICSLMKKMGGLANFRNYSGEQSGFETVLIFRLGKGDV